MFCWTDKWHGLTMADIRAIEDQTKAQLDEDRNKVGEVVEVVMVMVMVMVMEHLSLTGVQTSRHSGSLKHSSDSWTIT